MSVQDSMNEWGREFLRAGGFKVADDAEIKFKDEYYQGGGGCDTCGYGDYEEYTVSVSAETGPYAWREYQGSMVDLLAEMNGGGY